MRGDTLETAALVDGVQLQPAAEPVAASSNRRRGSASNWSSDGSARINARTRLAAMIHLAAHAALQAGGEAAACASSSALTGTAISAAPVGVGARTSAA